MDKPQEPVGKGSSVDVVAKGNQSTDDPTPDKSKRNKVPEAAAPASLKGSKSENNHTDFRDKVGSSGQMAKSNQDGTQKTPNLEQAAASDSPERSDFEDHQMEFEEEVSPTNKPTNSNKDKTQEAQPEQMQVSVDLEKQQKVLKELQGVMSDSSKYSPQAELLERCLHRSRISPEQLLDFFQMYKDLHEKYGRKISDRPVASSHKAKNFSFSSSMNPLSTTVKVFSVVTGQTFGAHDVILEKVSKSTSVEITDWQDCDVIMIFCPITSRVGSDVEAAMRNIPGDKPAILVLMHHTRKVDYSTDIKRWSEHYPNIKLEVHVLFHETQQGLLKCERNDQAAHQIQKALKSYSKYNFRR